MQAICKKNIFIHVEYYLHLPPSTRDLETTLALTTMSAACTYNNNLMISIISQTDHVWTISPLDHDFPIGRSMIG